MKTEHYLHQMKMAIKQNDKSKLSELVEVAKGNRRYTTEQLKIVERVRKGKKWLEANEDDHRYETALKTYEYLVDELKKQGISEEDAWNDDDTLFKSIFGDSIEEVTDK
jgi:hypothetical protein